MASSSNDPGKRDQNTSDSSPEDNDLETAEAMGGEDTAGPDLTRRDEEPVPGADAEPQGADRETSAGTDDQPFSDAGETHDLADPLEDEMAEPRDVDTVGSGPPPPGGPDDGRPDHGGDDGYGEEPGPSLAGRAFMLLIFALVIFGLSLWIVPNLAPHLPSGIARHLMPGQAELDNRLARFDQRLETEIDGFANELSALRQQNAALAERIDAAEKTATEAQSAAAESAKSAESNAAATDEIARAEQAANQASAVVTALSQETATLAEQMSSFEDRLARLSDQFQAVNESLASSAANGEPAAPELAAAFASLRSEVEDLRDRIGDGSEFLTEDQAGQFATKADLDTARDQILTELHQALQALPSADAIASSDELQALRTEAEGAAKLLAERIDDIGTTATKAAESAEAAEKAATSATARVDDAIREARISAVAATLDSRLATGAGFAAALDEAAALTNSSPPEELAHLAETGAPTVAELRASFGRPARNAIEATIEEESGGGILGQARARVGSVLAGRPAGEQQGQSVDAILSRIDARLRENDPAGALAEAETLPEPAQQALGQWLEKLRDNVSASAAARGWLTPAAPAAKGSDKGEG